MALALLWGWGPSGSPSWAGARWPFGLLRYALSRFGLPDDRVQVIVQTARASGEGGAFEGEPEIKLPDTAPELRERRDDNGRS